MDRHARALTPKSSQLDPCWYKNLHPATQLLFERQ